MRKPKQKRLKPEAEWIRAAIAAAFEAGVKHGQMMRLEVVVAKPAKFEFPVRKKRK